MVIISLFSWWYTTGWLTLMQKCAAWVQGVLGFFSVPLLLGSLFAPFRQISAGHMQGGSLSMQLRAWGDRMFSRVIGAVVRSFLIIIGLVLVAVLSVLCVVAIVAWPFLPFAPIAGFFWMGGSQ
jgi:hypothetical protein